MSYTLNGTIIRRPNSMEVDNSTQFAANRTLGGNNTRDYFGSNKRIWTLSYTNLNTTDFGVIDAIYQAFLLSGTVVPFIIDEGNYAVGSTNVQVDFLTRGFAVAGSSYVSNCTLILTET